MSVFTGPVHLGIISNFQTGYIETFLKAHGLGRYFDDFESFGATLRPKGENIASLVKRNGNEKAIYVGDTQGDCDAAKYAGLPFVLADYGFGSAPDADYVIDSLFKLPALAYAVLEDKNVFTEDDLKSLCLEEEKIAHIHGWDFSHINGRFSEDENFGWDYKETVIKYLKNDMKLLDIDTGGGEVLLSFSHPYENTCVTENYSPNVELCKNVLSPLGIVVRQADAGKTLPFDDSTFDIVTDRHGDFNASEIFRVLKPGGIFLIGMESNGSDNLIMKLSERLIDMVVYNDEEIKGFLKNNEFSDITIYLRDARNKQEIIKKMDGSQTRVDDDYDNVSFSDKFVEWMTVVARK
mgnify:CR=1 FL=1